MAVTVNILCPPHRLFIGHTGENNAREIVFDTSSLLGEYPFGAVSMTFERPDGQLCPIVVDENTSPVIWCPSFEETQVAGNGKLKILATSGTFVGRSCTIDTITVAGMGTGCSCGSTL